MVITKDSESFDPGSNPGRTYLFGHLGRGNVLESGTVFDAFGWMAEWSKALVSGTSLFGGESSNLSPIIFLS